jgi:hypothetical protein
MCGCCRYAGVSAAKVWSAIHNENCFQPPTSTHTELGDGSSGNGDDDHDSGDTGDNGSGGGGGDGGGSSDGGGSRDTGSGSGDAICLLAAEQRLYNRMLSGLHSSISLHIAHTYCLKPDPERLGECL